MLKLNLGATYYTVINDFKAISVTCDLTKAEKMSHLGPFSLNRTAVKNFQPFPVCNGYDHELKKWHLLFISSLCNVNHTVGSK